MKRYAAFFLSLLLMLSMFSGCGAGSVPVLAEPEAAGEMPNGKPQYRFRWDRVQGADSYEIAIYTEMDGYEGRTLSYAYNKPETNLIMLQGVNTDTVTYRVKVRGRLKGVGNYSGWSNVWKLDFVDGICTVSDNAEDFDKPEAPKETPAPKPAVTKPSVQKLPHSFPETLSEYIAHEYGKEDLDLVSAAELQISVYHCMYGEPGQTIRDGDIIAEAAAAFNTVLVTGKADNVSSTGDSFGFYFNASDGTGIGGAGFQDGLLLSGDGRYAVEGLESLTSIPGIMLFDEWDQFWDDYEEAESLYRSSLPDTPPGDVFTFSGYSAKRLLDSSDSADVMSLRLVLPHNYDVRSSTCTDPETVRAVFALLREMRPGEKVSRGAGQEWYIELDYALPDADYCPGAYIYFFGDSYQTDGTETLYAVDGIEELLKLIGGDAAEYLLSHRNERAIKPSF